MDHDSAEGALGSSAERVNQQVDNAIRAIQQKKPLPEIDFTIHVMEDGTQVSTQERVCKGTNPTICPEGNSLAGDLNQCAAG